VLQNEQHASFDELSIGKRKEEKHKHKHEGNKMLAVQESRSMLFDDTL
jgi:hypothetical protein